tara:strand:- start:3023 stop:3865 length:843 start_codon:yes stop_codon:yes gene_type:complete
VFSCVHFCYHGAIFEAIFSWNDYKKNDIIALMKFIIFLCFLNYSFATPLDETLSNLYKTKKYTQAIRLLKESEIKSKSYEYNLGVLYELTGETGKARAYLEIAHEKFPKNSAIQNHLEITRNQLIKKIGFHRANPLITSLNQWRTWLYPYQFRWIALTSLLFGGIFLLFSYRSRRRLQAFYRGPLAVFSWIFLILGTAISVETFVFSSFSYAYLLDEYTLRSGPGSQFLDVGKVYAGAQIKTTNHSQIDSKTGERWVQVEVAPSQIAWIPSSKIIASQIR